MVDFSFFFLFPCSIKKHWSLLLAKPGLFWNKTTPKLSSIEWVFLCRSRSDFPPFPWIAGNGNILKPDIQWLKALRAVLQNKGLFQISQGWWSPANLNSRLLNLVGFSAPGRGSRSCCNQSRLPSFCQKPPWLKIPDSHPVCQPKFPIGSRLEV